MHPNTASTNKSEGLTAFRLTYSDEGATRFLVDDILGYQAFGPSWSTKLVWSLAGAASCNDYVLYSYYMKVHQQNSNTWQTASEHKYNPDDKTTECFDRHLQG